MLETTVGVVPEAVKMVLKEGYPITPELIDADCHMFGTFDHMETETSAGWLVRFCQERKKGWAPFSYKDIEEFYKSTGKFKRFTFNRLIEPEMVPPSSERAFKGYVDPLVPCGGGWIVKYGDLYYFTHGFVVRCFKFSPKFVSSSFLTS